MKKEIRFLNVTLTQKKIIDLCGIVSYKRGEVFSKNHKVSFNAYYDEGCKAIVHGSEDFHVEISIKNHTIQAQCTCPKLASFQKDCQHIAAVLIECLYYKKNGMSPLSNKQVENRLTDNFMELFHSKQPASPKQQQHFENREVLSVECLLKIMDIEAKPKMLGLELIVSKQKVNDIRLFVSKVLASQEFEYSNGFRFNPYSHCFSEETYSLFNELNKINSDADLMKELFLNKEEMQAIGLPPSMWLPLSQALEKIPTFFYDSSSDLVEYRINEGILPIEFIFASNERNKYMLKITGLDEMILLPAYQLVLNKGEFTSLNATDFNRLAELKKMMKKVGSNHIPIAPEQVDFFMEKVVPSLKKLGHVFFNENAAEQVKKIPLQAELYLDRVNNRLLASLEFHYNHLIINPVEQQEINDDSLVYRDRKKEQDILELMEQSSFGHTESGYILYNEELEFEFLTYILPKLQKHVKVYATTAIRNRIFKEKTWPRFSVKVKKERTNWLEFTFEMEGFPEREIKGMLDALEEKRKYYRLQDGSLFSLQSRELEEIRRFLVSPEIKDKDVVSGFELSILESLSFIEEERSLFHLEDSYKNLMKSLRHPEDLEIEVPIELQATLKDYQITGFKWLKTLAHFGFGGILADDMGLGKTIQSIAFIASELAKSSSEKEKMLIVCPSSLIYNWQNEFMKFAPHIETLILDGSVKQREQMQKELGGIDVIITSYPLLVKDIRWYKQQVFRTIFFDEAQTFKNPLTQTAKSVKQLKAKNRFALTGTPMENAIEDLWSIFHIVFPELFHGLKEYANLTNKQIARKIKPFMLRRLKEDVLQELPSKVQWSDSVDLYAEQKTLYAAYLAKLRHKALKHLDKGTLRKNKIRILAGLTRLRQICCHPSLFVDNYQGRSAKLDQLVRLVEEAKNSQRRVLIFSQFTSMLGIIGHELTKLEVPFFYLDGSTPSEERVELCHRYNVGECDFFLISLKAGGTGLNLMTADTVIMYDTWWNPAVEEQATDRAHRIGQKNEVQVIKLLTRGTIEEKMTELQDKKKRLVDEIIDSEEKMISSLTEEDILSLLS